MYRLRFFRASTTLELRKNLIRALLFPHVDYCCLVYGDLSAELNLKLQRIINSGIRYIYGVASWEHISPYRRQLSWVSVANRRKYFVGVLLFKILNTGVPSYLARFFQRYICTRPSRDTPQDLVIPRFATETLRGSFHISSAYFWNSLPTSIREATSLSSFKSSLYTHLLQVESQSQ